MSACWVRRRTSTYWTTRILSAATPRWRREEDDGVLRVINMRDLRKVSPKIISVIIQAYLEMKCLMRATYVLWPQSESVSQTSNDVTLSH
jgi:hypothetical protein